ncbi:MAG TPA: DUF1553 domain-containing protein [Thermoanaerobaculia bacterium]|nr:DUF1553 domain-containing protein [Thermoanaerobaculia bacterium]
MRAGTLFLVALLAAGVVSRGDDEIVAPPAVDCTFHADQVRSAPEMWHRLSQIAEAVAPNASASGRHRATTPPKGDPFTARNFIDTEIFGKMVRDGIIWTSRSSDEEFLRRVTLDLTGEIPDPATVRAFTADTTFNKRDQAIDRLLASDAFVDRWTMWFGELVENVQVATNTTIGTTPRNAYYKFIHDSIQRAKPYDQMVRELMAGSGDVTVKGEANYYNRDRQNNGPVQDTYDNLSASTGARFLGLHLQCLSCHSGLGHLEQVNTGLSKKVRFDFWQNAAFFAQVQIDRVANSTGGQNQVINDNTTGAYRLNTTSGNKTPRQPVNDQATVDPAFFLTKETPRGGEGRRVAYGRILTAHPQFARATVNYLWKELFGLGIVEPADSFDLMKQDVQPTHPALLNQLGDAFAGGGFDLRGILKLMVTSNAYQLSSRYTPGTWNDSWVPYHARHYPRRLSAEEMVDAIVKATHTTASFNVNGMAAVSKAMQLPDTTEGAANFRTFMNGFGRGNRDDQPRSSDGSIVQALSLMNDRIVTDRVKASAAGSTVANTLQATKDPAAIAEALYVATLGRFPTATERQAAITYLGSGDLTRKTEDLQFALLNKLEFMFD